MSRLVYFGFGFEAIDSFQMRQNVMATVLGWLIGTSIRGTVELQGNMWNLEAQIHATCGEIEITTSSRPEGTFVLPNVPEGTCDVEVRAPAHLPARKTGVTVQSGEVTLLPPVRLIIGDLNGDGRNDALDLAIVAANLAKTESEWPGTPTIGDQSLAPES